MYRLRQLYQSIEPVQEEIDEENDRVRSYRKEKGHSTINMIRPIDHILQRRTSTPNCATKYMQSTASQLAKKINRHKLRRNID